MNFTPNSEIDLQIDGITIHTYFFSFNKENPTAIIVHGHRSDTKRLLPIIKLLEPKYNLISFDLPGFGKSKEVGKFEDYIEYVAEIFGKVLEELHLKEDNIAAFGTSLGANILLQYLLTNPEKEFKKLRLIAPIYSYKYISMSPFYKKFVDWLTYSLEKGGIFSKIFQKAADNRKLFRYLIRLFDKECLKSEEICDYEYRQYHLMTMQHWGATLKDFLQIDYTKYKDLIFNYKDVVFVYPQKDQYLDVKTSVEKFQEMFPNAEVKYFSSEKHMPRGDFVENEEFMESVRGIVELVI